MEISADCANLGLDLPSKGGMTVHVTLLDKATTVTTVVHICRTLCRLGNFCPGALVSCVSIVIATLMTSVCFSAPQLREVGSHSEYRLFEFEFAEKPFAIAAFALSTDNGEDSKLSVFTGQELYEFNRQFKRTRTVDFDQSFTPLHFKAAFFDTMFDDRANLQYIVGWAKPAREILVVRGDGTLQASIVPPVPDFSFWGKANYASLLYATDAVRVAVVSSGPVAVLLYTVEGELLWNRKLSEKGIVSAVSKSPSGPSYFVAAGGDLYVVPLDGTSKILVTGMPRSTSIINELDWDEVNRRFVIGYKGLRYTATVSQSDDFAKAVDVKQSLPPIADVTIDGPNGPLTVSFGGGRSATIFVGHSKGVAEHELDIGFGVPMPIPSSERRKLSTKVISNDMPPLRKGDALLGIASKFYVVRPQPNP
ncbi:MAG: hypothetical protein SFZ23_03690 [Planctomycetota bacterium]|nr:hypothetical protein [Planctomycetota bacterium]